LPFHFQDFGKTGTYFFSFSRVNNQPLFYVRSLNYKNSLQDKSEVCVVFVIKSLSKPIVLYEPRQVTGTLGFSSEGVETRECKGERGLDHLSIHTNQSKSVGSFGLFSLNGC
jgi:hypothetical protein